MNYEPPLPSLSLNPIGFIRTHMRVKFDAPHQPENSCDEENLIELLPHQDYEQALQDLSGFDRIWLIWWFHRNSTWRPLVLPPRGEPKRRGVFATRSPHRPNPIGMTAVPLIKISGRKLYVGNTDLVDGTPILDIKPYLASVDAFPDAKNGWLAEIEAAHKLPPEYTIKYSELAKTQITWLQEQSGINFIDSVVATLERDPRPHRTRRITRSGEHGFRMGCGGWRVYFSVQNQTVTIEHIASGYPLRLLEQEGYERVPDREAQLVFWKLWPE